MTNAHSTYNIARKYPQLSKCGSSAPLCHLPLDLTLTVTGRQMSRAGQDLSRARCCIFADCEMNLLSELLTHNFKCFQLPLYYCLLIVTDETLYFLEH